MDVEAESQAAIRCCPYWRFDGYTAGRDLLLASTEANLHLSLADHSGRGWRRPTATIRLRYVFCSLRMQIMAMICQA